MGAGCPGGCERTLHSLPCANRGVWAGDGAVVGVGMWRFRIAAGQPRRWRMPPSADGASPPEPARSAMSQGLFEDPQLLGQQQAEALAPERPGVTDVYGLVFAPMRMKTCSAARAAWSARCCRSGLTPKGGCCTCSTMRTQDPPVGNAREPAARHCGPGRTHEPGARCAGDLHDLAARATMSWRLRTGRCMGAAGDARDAACSAR